MSKTLILMSMALAVLASEAGYQCVQDDTENVRCFTQLEGASAGVKTYKTMSLDDLMK